MAYEDVSARGDFARDGSLTFLWTIRHTDFDPPGGTLSVLPYELLSQMQVERPIGVPGFGNFEISGRVQTTTIPGDETLSVGAVVETAQVALCEILVLG